jgi:hypothetical protein
MESEWKKHSLKPFMAWLGHRLQAFQLPPMYINKTQTNYMVWPSTCQVLAEWGLQVKLHPHHPKHAGTFSPEAIRWILNFEAKKARDITDQLVTSINNFSAMRMKESDNMTSKNTTYKKPSVVNVNGKPTFIPRQYSFVVDQMKNDMEGQCK